MTLPLNIKKPILCYTYLYVGYMLHRYVYEYNTYVCTNHALPTAAAFQIEGEHLHRVRAQHHFCCQGGLHGSGLHLEICTWTTASQESCSWLWEVPYVIALPTTALAHDVRCILQCLAYHWADKVLRWNHARSANVCSRTHALYIHVYALRTPRWKQFGQGSLHPLHIVLIEEGVFIAEVQSWVCVSIVSHHFHQGTSALV